MGIRRKTYEEALTLGLSKLCRYGCGKRIQYSNKLDMFVEMDKQKDEKDKIPHSRDRCQKLLLEQLKDLTLDTHGGKK